MVEKLSSTTEAQQQRILSWLREIGPLSTFDARQQLFCPHPGARVMELRRAGHHIVTEWITVDTGRSRPRIAKYVLLPSV